MRVLRSRVMPPPERSMPTWRLRKSSGALPVGTPCKSSWGASRWRHLETRSRSWSRFSCRPSERRKSRSESRASSCLNAQRCGRGVA
eukprot:5599929-Heterocapsa_arctica.AAC.1